MRISLLLELGARGEEGKVSRGEEGVPTMNFRRLAAVSTVCAVLTAAAGAEARSPVAIGTLPSGPLDGITDVAGVLVGNLTKIEGSGALVPGVGPVRTGATAILPDSDPWAKRPAAGWFMLNGNGEMTGTHWIDESGFMSSPIVLTDTLDIGRADDGVITWMIKKHPDIGIRDDTPLPVVAECDDAALNDIQGRHVAADDVAKLLDAARPGDFERGSVGAGTGMLAFGFKAGIGSASRVLPAAAGGYTVGVLVNDNTGSVAAGELDDRRRPRRPRVRRQAAAGVSAAPQQRAAGQRARCRRQHHHHHRHRRAARRDQAARARQARHDRPRPHRLDLAKSRAATCSWPFRPRTSPTATA